MEGSCRFAKSHVRILIKNKVAFYLSVDLDVCCLSAQAGKSSFVVWKTLCFGGKGVSEVHVLRKCFCFGRHLDLEEFVF